MKNAHIWGALVLLVLPLAAADMQLTQASVHAPSVERGADISLTYTLVADSTLSRVSTDVYLPGGINHKDVRTVNARSYKHKQVFTLPRSYNGDEEILVRIDTPTEAPIIARIPLQSEAQRQTTTTGTEKPAQPIVQADSGVAVLVDPVRDVVPGDAIYYRAQIINTGDQAQTATIGLSDVSQWATYRVDPARTVQLSPGEQKDVYIYLDVDEQAAPGVRYFDVTATHGATTESATVKLAVLKPITQKTNAAPWIIGAALLLLIAAVIFVAATYIKQRDNENNGGEDDDFVTYY